MERKKSGAIKRKATDGGGEDLFSAMPSEFGLNEFVEARAAELEAMHHASRSVHGNARVMQQLPRHMRRRAASHNVKRLPRRIRHVAQMETIDNAPVKTKRPSRKHRRRPGNLLAEYARRQRAHVWLETHIWHGKRFHMAERWGYKMADFPNDKGFRACYRGLTGHCVMWDMSYLCCIEIVGKEVDIVSPLKRLMTEETGPTVGAKMCLDGSREGSAILYQHDCYPRSAIGPVTFHWRPLQETNTRTPNAEGLSEGLSDSVNAGSVRTLWLWVHPSCYQAVLDELMLVFDAKKVVADSLEINGGSEGKNIEEERMEIETETKMENRNKHESVREETCETKTQSKGASKNKSKNKGENEQVSKDKIKDSKLALKEKNNKDKAEFRKNVGIDNPKFVGEKVNFQSLKDTLCRFRLLGPKSHGIVKEALRKPAWKVTNGKSGAGDGEDAPNSTEGKAGKREGMDMEEVVSEEVNKYWWEDYLVRNDQLIQHKGAWDQLKGHDDSAQLRRGSILGLTVRDPRLFIPQKITSVTQEVKVGGRSQVADAVHDRGWESSWSDSPLWEADVRGQVRDSKLTEHQLNIRRGHKLIPGSVPDLGDSESRIPVLLLHRPAISHPPFVGSGYDLVLPSGWGMPFWISLVYRGARVGGLRQLQQIDRELGRVNFVTGYPDTPAGQQWDDRIAAEETKVYKKKPPAKRVNYVKLGTQRHAFQIPWGVLCGLEDRSGAVFVLRCRQVLKQLQKSVVDVKLADSLSSKRAELTSALVPVTVTAILKGQPSPKAAISLPTREDLASLKADTKFPGPSEPIHVVEKVKDGEKRSKLEVKRPQEGEKMKIEVESPVKVIKCSRDTIGYLTEGDVSLSIGKGRGLGFVTYGGLLDLIGGQTGEKLVKVLARGVAETVYRFYKIEINC